jgi:hypothetical protein
LLAVTAIVLAVFGEGRFQARLVISLIAAGWVLARWLTNPRSRIERAILMVPLVALLVVSVKVEMYQKTVKMYSGSWFKVWTVYHYYMGSKYFDEVGYYDLYLQTIVADREDWNRTREVDRVCDQRSYRFRDVEEMLPPGPNPEFTAERWREFKRDLRAFTGRTGRDLWPSLMRDRGYNASPFWTVVGGSLSNRLSIRSKPEYLVLMSADLILYLVAFVILAWAFGPERAMLATIAVILMPVSFGRLVGGFLRHDWLAAIFIGAALVERRRPVAAGISFGYAAMARAFPALLLAGLAVPIARRVLENRRVQSFDRRLIISFLLFCAVAAGAGCLTARGPTAWADWFAKMRTHNDEAPYWNRSTGLKHFFVHDIGDFSENSFTTDPTSRKEILKRQSGWYAGSSAVFGVLLLISLWITRSDTNAILLSSIAVFVLLVSSHYYWAIFGLLPLWRNGDSDARKPMFLAPILVTFLVPATWYWFALDHQLGFQRFVFLDLLMGLAFLVVMTTLIWRSAPLKIRAPEPGTPEE